MNSEQIFELIVREIRAVLPDLENHPIGREDAMADLGVDSIERKDVIVATLEALDLRIPLVQVHGPRNLGELADLLHARLQA